MNALHYIMFWFGESSLETSGVDIVARPRFMDVVARRRDMDVEARPKFMDVVAQGAN